MQKETSKLGFIFNNLNSQIIKHCWNMNYKLLFIFMPSKIRGVFYGIFIIFISENFAWRLWNKVALFVLWRKPSVWLRLGGNRERKALCQNFSKVNFSGSCNYKKPCEKFYICFDAICFLSALLAWELFLKITKSFHLHSF